MWLATAADPADPVPQSEIDTARIQLEHLQKALNRLRHERGLSQDYWADAQVFVKGAVWALDLEPIVDAAKFGLIQKAIARATERERALSDNLPNWPERKGRSIRGFVSKVDGSTQPYGITVPRGYDGTRPMRLDIVLHGSSGSRATGIGDLMFMNGYDDGDTGDVRAPDVNYIELFPMGRLGENSYRFEGETDVDEAVEAVCRNYRIDRNRLVLRGSSLGGVGTWQMGLKRPDRYVALGPAAGPIDTIEFSNSPWPHFVRLDPLTPWQKSMLHLVDAIDYVPNGRMVPVIAAMGDQDHYFSSHQLAQRTFDEERVPFVGLVDRGAGHGITSKVMQEQLRLLGEHAAIGREPAPRRIQFVTWTLKYSRCFWLEVLGLETHYERSEIDATLAEDGSVDMVEPKNVTRLVLRPPALKEASATLRIGGRHVSVPVAGNRPRALVIERSATEWKYRGDMDQVELSGKRPGIQGPIDDAFATKFLCVRGTGIAWNPRVAAWAEANLRRFQLEWRRHYRGELPVKEDTMVTEEDVRTSNLILFGDPGSNRWIRRLLPRLPIQWTREQVRLGTHCHPASDHAIQLIYPNPLPQASGHYVVINSGHTYHDSELRLSYMVFPRVGDWAVLRVGDSTVTGLVPRVDETVLDSGFFDERWRMTF